MKRISVLVAVIALTASAKAVTIDMVTVGNPGNAPNVLVDKNGVPTKSIGAVDHVYQIAKYEVTAGQYTEFLNAVAKDDPHLLYSTSMGVISSGSRVQTSNDPVLPPTTATAWPPTGPTGR